MRALICIHARINLHTHAQNAHIAHARTHNAEKNTNNIHQGMDMLVGNIRGTLRKLAIALKNLDLEDAEEEMGSLDEMIESYYGQWIDKLPKISGMTFGVNLKEREFLKFKNENPEYKEFDWAGSGAFRVVMSLEGDDSFVIKLARNAHGSKMNKSEFERQQEFEGMFPKVHHHGSKEKSSEGERSYKGQGFDWIVAEKAKPIASDDELEGYFPNLTWALGSRGLTSFYGFGSILGRFMSWNKGFSLNEEEDYRHSLYEFEKHIGVDVLADILSEAKKDPLFNKISYLAYKLNLNAEDLGVGNLGINSANNLVIIDASLEEDFKSPYN